LKDQRKTKAQLIDELQAERQKTAGGDSSTIEVQLAVERVRAAVVDMRDTSDLHKVISEVLKQMISLGVQTPGASIFLVDRPGDAVTLYTAMTHPRLQGIEVFFDSSSSVVETSETVTFGGASRETFARWIQKAAQGRSPHVYQSQTRNTYDSEWDGHPVSQASGDLDGWEKTLQGHWSVTNVPFRFGVIGYRERVHCPEHDDIVAELAQGLELGFLRFLDFQKVEQQNRELTVQNALEQVRMRALGMQRSDELGEVTSVLFAQFRGLGHELLSAAILVEDKAAGSREFWGHWRDGPRRHGKVPTPYPAGSLRDTVDEDERVRRTGAPWRVLQQEGEALVRWLRDLYEVTGYSPQQSFEEILQHTPDRIFQHRVFHERGLIELALEHPLSDDDLAVAKRFTDVFDYAYSRFLELKTKEEQNRALEVERALERVRTGVAGMLESADLPKVVDLVDESLRELGVPLDMVSINTVDEEAGVVRNYYHERTQERSIHGPGDHTGKLYELWQKGETFVRHWDRDDYRRWEQQSVDAGHRTLLEQDQRRATVDKLPDRWVVDVPFTYGTVAMNRTGSESFTDCDIGLLERFTEVFALGYRRHLDLAAAEERARQAELDGARQRLRSEVMSMKTAHDIEHVVAVMKEELIGLGVSCDQMGINIVDDESGTVNASWTSLLDVPTNSVRSTDQRAVGSGEAQLLEHFRRGEVWSRSRSVDTPGEPGWVVDVPFQYGTLAMNRGHTNPDAGQFTEHEVEILGGFADVVSLSYARFLDFQRLEEQNESLIIDRAVERIRAEAMAMTSSDDLLSVSGLVLRELLELDVATPECMIGFYEEEQEQLHWHYAVTDLDQLGISYDASRVRRLANGFCVSHLVERTDGEMLTAAVYGKTAEWLADMRTHDSSHGAFEDDIVERVWALGQLRRFGIEDTIETQKLLRQDYGMVHISTFWGRGFLGLRGADIDIADAPRIEAILVEFSAALALGFQRFLDFQQLEQATLNKSQFLRRMSHDLRSPMNAIIGYTRLLRRRLADRVDEREARNLANIETSSGNLLNLINDILDLSRIEAGRIEVNLQSVDVCALANECADALESIVHENVVLRRDLHDVGVINSDPDRLRQVLMNLLGNATKFTETGSITLFLRREGDAVELVIADTGVGIPSADLPHIFDEFRQVERQGGEQTEGTGLGLAIARKTVDLLGGEITATSEVGVGTTFTVRLGRDGVTHD
jgi:signal transduction histidine kinase